MHTRSAYSSRWIRSITLFLFLTLKAGAELPEGEWCADMYHATGFAERKEAEDGVCCNPAGPDADAKEPLIPGDPSPPTVPGQVRRVIKGGSFLCHPDYCESYRPSARRGTSPDTGTSHIGFRCVKDISTP